MQAMILAAGFGTRLRPYSLLRPKPLFPVLNRPLLLRHIDTLRQIGCADIHINSHHLHEQIAAVLTPEKNISLSHENEILGTGGSLRQMLNQFTAKAEQPLIIINGDVVHNIDLRALYSFHCRHNHSVSLALHDYPRFNKVSVRNGRVSSFATRTAPVEDKILAFTGIHILDPAILTEIPENCFFNIIDLYTALIKRGETIAAYRVDGCYWRDMGTPQDYLQVHKDLLTGKAGITFRHQENRDSPFLIHPQAELEPGVDLRDWACIGAKARIAAKTRIERAVIWDSTEIAPGAVIQDEIISA